MKRSIVSLLPCLIGLMFPLAMHAVQRTSTHSITSSPSLPPPVVAAGFTTQMVNADFTSSANSSPSAFVDNCGATALYRWYWDYFLSTTPLNCGDISIVSDGRLPQVLLVSYPPAEYNPSTNRAGANFTFPRPGYTRGRNACLAHISCLPNEGYYEMLFRTSAASWDNGGGRAAHFGAYLPGRGITAQDTFPPNQWFENNFFESVGGGRFANPNGGGGIGGICAPGVTCGYVTWQYVDFTQYHKLGVLTTSDGSTSYVKCTYLDGTLVQGVSGPYNTGKGCTFLQNAYTDPTVYSQHDNVVSFQLDWFSGKANVPNQVWIQYVRVWECAGWATGQCNGSTLYGPDGNNLAYWHN